MAKRGRLIGSPARLLGRVEFALLLDRAPHVGHCELQVLAEAVSPRPEAARAPAMNRPDRHAQVRRQLADVEQRLQPPGGPAAAIEVGVR